MKPAEDRIDDSDTPEAVYEFVGRILLQTQHFEFVLGSALKLVFSDQSQQSAEAFFKKDKRSLGRLLNDLRSVVSIEKDVDNWMTNLVEHRNIFAHHLFNQEGFTTETAEGRNLIWGFLATYYELIEQATLLFTAIIMEFQSKRGIVHPEAEKYADFIKTLEQYVPEIDKLKPKKG